MAKVVEHSQEVRLCRSAPIRSMLDPAVVDAAPRALAVMDEGPDAELRDFYTQAIVVHEIGYMIVGGRFSPTIGIDLTCQDVILSVAGADNFRLSVSAGSFTETGLGGYVASAKCGSVKADILLQPFSRGDWAYSVGMEGIVPGSTSVTVSLTIGSQDGSASAKVYEF